MSACCAALVTAAVISNQTPGAGLCATPDTTCFVVDLPGKRCISLPNATATPATCADFGECGRPSQLCRHKVVGPALGCLSTPPCPAYRRSDSLATASSCLEAAVLPDTVSRRLAVIAFKPNFIRGTSGDAIWALSAPRTVN